MADPISTFDIRTEQQDAYSFRVVFDREQFQPLVMDEPPPLGKDAAPGPSRILAAAIGNCLCASLVFCMQRQHRVALTGVTATIHVDIVRNEQKRLRVGGVSVKIDAGPQGAAHPEALEACRGAFEDFCTVTASIRQGIPVVVSVL